MVHASEEQIQTHTGETGGTEETLLQRLCKSFENEGLDKFMEANRAEFEPSKAAALRVSVPQPTPTIKREGPSARPPPWGGTLPPYLSGPPVFPLQHAARTIFAALVMKVRDPSIRRCRAWPPYDEFPPASSFQTADRKYFMWTASHWFVPAACARTRTLTAKDFTKHGWRNRCRHRIPLGRVALRTWSPQTVNTIRTGISSVTTPIPYCV